MTTRKPVDPVILSLTVQKADGSGCDSYRLTAETLEMLIEKWPALLNKAERNRLIPVRHSQQEVST